jgi:hypothetical protein
MCLFIAMLRVGTARSLERNTADLRTSVFFSPSNLKELCSRHKCCMLVSLIKRTHHFVAIMTAYCLAFRGFFSDRKICAKASVSQKQQGKDDLFPAWLDKAPWRGAACLRSMALALPR